ncbi:DUF262 domain-containing protein [Luteibacter sp. dw_328]|uniref:DUF262 domain-containing protein n=1 Tax=Luteibacter sp. dw_328 TaxID=2719796 RepID=UPI001BD48AC3|nr:DUF262 domain-containing protein [Luteibacter sp. dw_328]
MRLDPKHYTLAQLLQGRLFRIPDYQRPYAWRKQQRDELFSDIEEVQETDQDHFMATVVALVKDRRKIVADEYTAVDLVDGQQRITTLIVLLKAVEQALDLDDKVESKIRSEIKDLLVKTDDHSLLLLQTNHDSTNVFADYIRSGAYGANAHTTEAERNLIDACMECQSFVTRWQKTSTLIDLVSILRNRLSMIYHELTDEASVYRVFEVLNSRGLDVKQVDKVKSQLMALIFSSAKGGAMEEALDEMREIWRRIYRTVGLRGTLADQALRFAGTLQLSYIPNRILSEEDAAAELIRAAGKDLPSIIKVARILESIVESIDKLDQNHRIKAVTSVMQARFAATCIDIRKLAASDALRTMKAWEHVTFLVYGLGGSDKRKKVGEYTRLGHEIVNGSMSADAICDRLIAIPGSDHHIDKVLANADWSDCYSGWAEPLRYILYRYEEHLSSKHGEKINVGEWKKIWQQDPSKSIEHITPQSSNRSFIHQLGNLTMLPPGVNSSLRDKSPADKIKAYEDSGIRATRHVAAVVRKEGWKAKNVETRTNEIIEFIREEWSL